MTYIQEYCLPSEEIEGAYMFSGDKIFGNDSIGGLEDLDDLLQKFDASVPHGEEAFVVLKSHLFVERALVEFVKARIDDPKFNKEVFGNNSPFRNGLELIILAQGLSMRDEILHAHADIVWPALKKLNNIRNTLAHELEPDSSKLGDKMRDFAKSVDKDVLTIESDVNRAFRKCAALLVAYLHIDKNPLSAGDAW